MLLQPADERAALWKRVTEIAERYVNTVDDLPVAPEDPTAITRELQRFDFTHPMSPQDALASAADLLSRYTVHTPHPRYFGLFNPAPATMAVMADALVAAFNPQLAAWSHAPFAVSLEAKLVRDFGRRFGFAQASGAFTSGGGEANATAVLCALAHRFPAYREDGLQSLNAPVAIYTGPAPHHSVLKAARAAGLGTRSVRMVPADAAGKMDAGALRRHIEDDMRAGISPLMIVATAGATSTGIIDPLDAAADVAKDAGTWLHVDAAWGGFAMLVPELRSALCGIERADSVTFDPHKMLSVSMGAGLFLTPHASIMGETFGISTNYMPALSQGDPDPYTHSMQWSRRFIGLKVFLSLLVAGWDGYAQALRRQTAMGEYLRGRLIDDGWIIENDTPLPVICFRGENDDARATAAIADAVVSSGKAWISTTTLANGTAVLRACITNYRTVERDVDLLIHELRAARAASSLNRSPGDTV